MFWSTKQQTNTQNHFLLCKQTHSHTLSVLSCVWGIVRVLLSPQVFLPDLRDDVIGFFECLKERTGSYIAGRDTKREAVALRGVWRTEADITSSM